MVSKLDANQVLPAAFDDASQSLKVTGAGFDPVTGAIKVSPVTGTLITAAYDNLLLTYVPSGPGVGEIQTVVYKLGGSTVSTLTLTYDGSNRISTITKS